MSKNTDYSGKTIFISHASKDKELVDVFVKNILMVGIGLTHDEIFCTSLEGMDIKNGDDFRNAIRDALLHSKIALLIITPHYKQSEVCLNEMGAAWIADKRVIPLIVEPINYKTVGVIMEPNQVGKLNDVNTLGKLRDDICESLGMAQKNTPLWESSKTAFLTRLAEHLGKSSFDKPVDAKEFRELLQAKTELEKQISGLTSEYGVLQQKFEEVGKLKNKAEVDAVASKFSDTSKLEEFEGYTTAVKKALRPLAKVVAAKVVCDFFSQPYDPPYSSYSSDLDEAVRRKILSDDGFSARPESRAVQAVSDAIRNLNVFLEKALQDQNFCAVYDSEYTSGIETDVQDFWEEHFDLVVPS